MYPPPQTLDTAMRKYAAMTMTADSGKSLTVTGTVSGRIGLSYNENSSTATITIPFSALPTDATVGCLKSLDIQPSSGGYSGQYAANCTIQLSCGEQTTELSTFSVSSSSYVSRAIINALETRIGEFLNLAVWFGRHIGSEDSVTLTITTTRVSGTGSDGITLTKALAVINYIP